jgi:acetate CoA/acetoacetate CoA-transferase alpha subunit
VLEKPIITAAEAAAKVNPGDVLMVGGFLGCGNPQTLIHAIKDRAPKGLTLICNDTAMHDLKTGTVGGVAYLVQAKLFKKIFTSHIGLNQETQRQMNSGETDVELVPQGTLAERVRAGGFGLGGILTPTGLGTEVQEGKQVITVGDRSFLLELPLRANVAIIKAQKADKAGNLVFAGTARNFNPLMATAADLVIAEAEEIVEVGEIDPNDVHTSSIFVDFLVKAERLDMWGK